MMSNRSFGALVIAAFAVVVAAAPPGVAQTCLGDCDHSGDVTVDELLSMVSIALGAESFSSCNAGDGNGDSLITVEEILSAIERALSGCPIHIATPTPTQRSVPTPNATVFREGWQRSRVGTYHPNDFINGDTGDWYIGDTVSGSADPNDANDPGCGESPHTVEIVRNGEQRELRMVSRDSNSSCSDNIFIGPVNRSAGMFRNLDIAITEDLYITFRETGSLDGTDVCDGVLLSVSFDQIDEITYELQRGSDPLVRAFGSGCHSLFHPNLIPISEVSPGLWTRNVFEDALAAGVVNPRSVSRVDFEIDEHGSATFDDIIFFRAQNLPTPTPTATPRADNCTRIREGKWCLTFDAGGDSAETPVQMQQDGCVVTIEGGPGTLVGNHLHMLIETSQGDVEIDGDFSGNPANRFNGSFDIGGIAGSVSGKQGGC